MNKHTQFNNSSGGYDLADNAAKNVTQQLSLICAHEKRRVQKANEPAINGIKIQLGSLHRERQDLRVMLLRPRTTLDLVHKRRRNFAFAILLGLASLVLGHLALQPFGLGWESWLLSAAFAAVGGFWTEIILERYHAKGLTQAAFLAMLLVSLTGLVILAVMRGDVLIFTLRSTLAGTIPNDDASTTMITDAVHFYSDAAFKLKWLFALLTVGLDVGMGLAMFEAWQIDTTSRTEAEAAAVRVREIEVEASELVVQLATLENEPEVFEAEFHRNIHLGLQDGTRRDFGRAGRFVAALVLTVALAQHSFAQPIHVVMGIDFSKSEKTDERAGASAHDQDIQAAASLILRLPPGAKLMVGGITDQSFSRPQILLSDQVPSKRGQLEFLDQIVIAKKRMAAKLRSTANAIPTDFQQTDVLGFMIFAGQKLQQAAQGRKMLIVFSDMRHSTAPVNIEAPKLVNASMLRIVQQQHFLADLRGVDVYLLGVHAAGKDVRYWQSLRDFYTAYCTASGANLRMFSLTRDMPDFSPAQ